MGTSVVALMRVGVAYGRRGPGVLGDVVDGRQGRRSTGDVVKRCSCGVHKL